MDSGATRNYILLAVVERLGLTHRQKERPYPLVTILGDLIIYGDGII